MENEKTLSVLKSILENHKLNAEEKEAVMSAIGLLSLVSQSKNRAKAAKGKRDKSTEW
jgi:predicted nucleic-acid-binding protein